VTVVPDLYAEWAPSYPPRAHNPLMAVEERAMLELMPALRGLAVLDAGCGTGRYARLARARGARSVVAVDRSEAMLHGCAVRGVARVRGDLRALPVASASCAVVVSGLMLPDVEDLDAVVREWGRVVEPGGIILCSTLHPIGGEMGWTRTFATARGMRTLPAYWHTLPDLQRACVAAGIVVDEVREPRLDSNHPVALVVRARRRA
jgi:malonyl-CoA O-methyltransferase